MDQQESQQKTLLGTEMVDSLKTTTVNTEAISSMGVALCDNFKMLQLLKKPTTGQYVQSQMV